MIDQSFRNFDSLCFQVGHNFLRLGVGRVL
jgi:hypothetical protein